MAIQKNNFYFQWNRLFTFHSKFTVSSTFFLQCFYLRGIVQVLSIFTKRCPKYPWFILNSPQRLLEGPLVQTEQISTVPNARVFKPKSALFFLININTVYKKNIIKLLLFVSTLYTISSHMHLCCFFYFTKKTIYSALRKP